MRLLACLIILLVLVSSCTNHADEVDNAIKDLEWIDARLDDIGERSIKGYKQAVHVPGISRNEQSDSITLSESEFRDIQTDLYRVIEDLENLSMKMEKETETD